MSPLKSNQKILCIEKIFDICSQGQSNRNSENPNKPKMNQSKMYLKGQDNTF